MKKNKLIEMRELKGFSQPEIADKLNMSVSSYSRRENGEIKITNEQWKKLSNILNVPLEDIHEYDEKQIIINKDNTSVNYQGTNHICNVPESLLESLQEYINILKEENRELKLKVERNKTD